MTKGIELVNAYCGYLLVRNGAEWMCVDSYTMTVKAKGTETECRRWFANTMGRIASC